MTIYYNPNKNKYIADTGIYSKTELARMFGKQEAIDEMNFEDKKWYAVVYLNNKPIDRITFCKGNLIEANRYLLLYMNTQEYISTRNKKYTYELFQYVEIR